LKLFIQSKYKRNKIGSDMHQQKTKTRGSEVEKKKKKNNGFKATLKKG